MVKYSKIFALVTLLCCVAPLFGQKIDINGYKYAHVAEMSDDPASVSEYFGELLEKEGFTIVVNLNTLNASEILQAVTFNLAYSYRGGLDPYAKVKLKVYDAYSGKLLKETNDNSMFSLTGTGAVKSSIKGAFKDLKYKGFDQSVHASNLKALYPKSAIYPVTEEEIKISTPTSSIEGIWTEANGNYRIGIVRDKDHKIADYVGVVLESGSPIWNRGEIKVEFMETASKTFFTGRAFSRNKTRLATNFTLENGNLIKYQITSNNKTDTVFFVRVWPSNGTSIAPEGSSTPPSTSGHKSSGTGFLISSDGVLATNFHVVDGAKKIVVLFPKNGKEYEATVILKDKNNDIVLVRLDKFVLSDIGVKALPYDVMGTRSLGLGDRVFTIGYPIESIMGQNAKYTDGSISSKSGLGDDMVHLQINASIQPGNSGSPLFDKQGNVVGVIVSSLNSSFMQKKFGIIPQNVNFAIKGDYLQNLISMLPEAPQKNIIKSNNPEELSKVIGLIKCY